MTTQVVHELWLEPTIDPLPSPKTKPGHRAVVHAAPFGSRYAFLSFTCVALGDGKEFLQEDPDEQCNTLTHTLWVALVVAGVFFYAIGIPLLGYRILTSVDKLDKPHVQLKYAFLYDG